MTDKKIIAVVGATGSQGGGLARAILADPDGPFALRALTRNADSPKAKEFAAHGAEVIEADLDDEASMRAAFEDAYGAFIVTNFWVQRTPEEEAARTRAQMELEQASTAARAAKDAGLKHVVWSTLEDTRPHFEHLGSELPTLLDVYKVSHFDAKGVANAFFTDLGVPTTFLETTFYYESFLVGQGPHRNENGELVLTNPMSESVMALVASEDIGRTALGIFRAGAKYIGRTVLCRSLPIRPQPRLSGLCSNGYVLLGVCLLLVGLVSLAGAHATGDELAALFTKVLGEKVSYRPLSHDEVRASGTPGSLEIANMYQFYAEASESFIAARNLDLAREINPQLKPLEEWLTEHKDEIPLD
jgi:uncharacterized protein YbjT (DUF2867 family)